MALTQAERERQASVRVKKSGDSAPALIAIGPIPRLRKPIAQLNPAAIQTSLARKGALLAR